MSGDSDYATKVSPHASSPVQAARINLLEHVLGRIAHGEAKDPRVEAKVALGELPIGALLTQPDPDVHCVKCNNKGRTTRGPGKQQFGCPGCGYLVGEHPKYHAMRGST